MRGGFNRLFRAGEEMPSLDRFRAVEAFESHFLFLRGHFRRVMGIEADDNHFVVTAGVEGEHAQSADDTSLDLVAQHRAAVINEREDHGLLAEEVAKWNIAAAFIAKVSIERHLAIEWRLETDVLQGWRHGGRGWANVTGNGLSLQRAACCEQRENSENVARLSHLLISSSPPAALKRKANPSLRRSSWRLTQ